MNEARLILTLLLREEWVAGRTIRELAQGKLNCGCVYTHLDKLKRMGAVEMMIEERDESNKGQVLNRMYRITGEGLRVLAGMV